MKRILIIFFSTLALLSSIPVYGAKNYWKMSISKLEKLASKNDAQAQYCLGYNYANGKGGVAQDFSKSAYWYGKAAAAGHGAAQFYLAVYYMQGNGVEQNPQEAIRLFQACVDNPKVSSDLQFQARINLANYHGNGKYGLEKNVDKAIELLENARLAYFSTDYSEMELYGIRDDMLGQMYFKKANETLESSDYKKSADSYVKAADDWYRYLNYNWEMSTHQKIGNSWLNAANSLFFYNTFQGLDDFSKVMEYWRKAYDKGNRQACYNLGELYYTGIGNMPADEARGMSYLDKVADENPRAAYFLGLHYYAKESDFAKAFDYLNKVLVNPDLTDKDVRADVLQKLSAMYRFGRGTTVNEAKADALSAEAAQLGNPDAVRIQQWLNQK
jgi:Sel1 repeat protein